MIFLVLSFLISTCHGLINGNLICETNVSYIDLNHYDACDTIDYNSTQRIIQFGVDCCIREAVNSMSEFFKIARKITLRLDVYTVSLIRCIMYYIIIMGLSLLC